MIGDSWRDILTGRAVCYKTAFIHYEGKKQVESEVDFFCRLSPQGCEMYF